MLIELRAAFAAAEAEMEDGISPRVLPFADLRDLGSLPAARRSRAPGHRRGPSHGTLRVAARPDARPAPHGGGPIRSSIAAGGRCGAPRWRACGDLPPNVSPIRTRRIRATFEIVFLGLGAAREEEKFGSQLSNQDLLCRDVGVATEINCDTCGLSAADRLRPRRVKRMHQFAT